MAKIYVHDFSFDYVELDQKIYEGDFFCGVRIHYNFSPEDPGSGWDNLEYFFISVATPFGVGSYLKRCIDKGLYPNNFFFPNLLVVNSNNEGEIMDFLRTELHAIYGKTENEILLKALRKFGWENETNPEVYNKIFR